MVVEEDAGAALMLTGVEAGLISIVLSSIIDRTMNKIHGGSFIAGWTGGITIACLVIQVFGNSLGTVFESLFDFCCQ